MRVMRSWDVEVSGMVRADVVVAERVRREMRVEGFIVLVWVGGYESWCW